MLCLNLVHVFHESIDICSECTHQVVILESSYSCRVLLAIGQSTMEILTNSQ